MTELTKNRIAAALLIPYLAYLEAMVTSTIGILFAPIIVAVIWSACKTFPGLRNNNVFTEARFTVLLLTIWNLISGKNLYGSLLAFFVLMVGVYACQAVRLLWTTPVPEKGVT